MSGQIHIVDKTNSNCFSLTDLKHFFDLSKIGFWKAEKEEGKEIRMYMDSNMQSLMGIPEGLSPEESYSFYYGHIHPEDHYVISRLEDTIPDKDMVAEYRYEHPDAGELRIRCRCKKVEETDHCITIIGYEQAISDIIQLGSGTRREDELLQQTRDLEQKQVQTNDYYRNLLDMMHCGVVSYTLPGHKMLHMNAEALRIYGVKDLDEAQNVMGDILRKVTYVDLDVPRKLKRLHYENGAVDYECTIRNLQGEEINVLARTEIFLAPSNERCLVTTFLDISENTALRNEKSTLEALCADYTAVYIYDLDTDYVIPVYPTNDDDEHEGRKRLGKGIRNFSARARFIYDHMLVKESAPDFMEKINADYLRKYLAEHRRFIYRVRLKPNALERENYEIQVVRLNAAEGFKVIVGFHYIDDVIREEERQKIALEHALASERDYKKRLEKKAEEARLANEAKTNFLRRMSHDIRTPLNGIIGLIKIDEAHYDDMDLVKENHKKMNTSANHLLSLINDVLQMSKLEDGKIVLSHEVIDLVELTQDIVYIIIGRAVEAGIEWDYEKGKSNIPYRYIYGSPLHLRQIFLNIYGNCIKYNRRGGKITTIVEALEEKDGVFCYRWTISDTGIGMSEEFLKHIFNPFAQERNTNENVQQGIGLGMSIVKGLLEQMGGTIEIASKEGVGSTFVITIPFEVAQESIEMKRDIDRMNNIQGLHLMMVEDNELNAEIAQTLLEDEGAKLTIVTNGKEAVDLFERTEPGTFDAVLMDMMMPVMDGVTATKYIRALEHDDARKIPIIAMTANAFKEDVERCLAAGMNGHVAKPIDIEKIKRELEKHCRK